MPTYDFRCSRCGHAFEAVSSFAERDEKAVCPACGSREVTTVISSFSVGGLRTRFNPGTFTRRHGEAPKYTPPAKP